MVAEITARNEPAKILEIPKYYPPIPKSENAFTPLADAGSINRLVSRTWDWKIFQSSSQDYFLGLDSTNREMFESILAKNAAQLAALDLAITFTNGYYDPLSDYRSPPLDLFYYGELALVEWMIAIDRSDSNRVDKAAERTLRFAALLRQQPLWYAQHSAVNLLSKGSIAFELASYKELLSPSALERMQALVALIDSPTVLPRILKINQVAALDPPIELRTRWFRMQAPGILQNAFMEITGTRQQQTTLILDRFQSAFTFLSEPDCHRFDWARNLPDYFPSQGMPPPSLSLLFDNQIRATFLIDSRASAQIRLLETALAALRYERLHRSYPPTLEALIPQFLPALRLDPFSGASLKWKHSSQEAMLWSVGPNGVDDAGLAGFNGSADLTFHFRKLIAD